MNDHQQPRLIVSIKTLQTNLNRSSQKHYNEHVDYVAYYFQHSYLTKIRGEPTYKTLKKKNELCANTISVSSNLGGGNHGYLGLILDNVEYQYVSGGVEFNVPLYLSFINVGAIASAVEAVHLREQHHELVRKYIDCHNIEKALLCHIQQALDYI